MLRVLKNQKGLSLVETMVSLGLVVFIVSLAQTARVQYRSEYSKSSDIISKQKLLRGLAQELMDTNSQLPLITDSKGLPGTFVRCFDRKGRPLSNSTGDAGALFVSGSADLKHDKYSGNCTPPAATPSTLFFEVHITRNTTNPSEIQIWVISQDALANGKLRNLATRTLLVIPTEL